MKHVATGEIVEVGNLLKAQGTTWPAVAIKVDGYGDSADVYIPLTVSQAMQIGASLYDRVSITIETVPQASEGAVEP